MTQGKFIVFEGLDRSGKTTIVDSLYDSLSSMGDVRKMRFPNRSGNIGKVIDAYLRKEINLENETIHLLFSGDRYEQKSTIEELRKSSILLCDRYSLSGASYSVAKGLDLDWCVMVDSGLPKPDMTIFIDIPLDEISRRKGFGNEVHDHLPFLEKVLSAYKVLLKREKNVLIVDGTFPISSIVEIVKRKILE
ncbi:thymidylate kinase [Encephalitozoon intestinalis ATCC 50506]|uniref:dTMP kinase n=1 Tax=Encephalitozoon intestinalis (strain ATCC 50506) TaxID=876142 RepID=E0S6S4_ENCIT|nr:thymidylate kinase [Encephalitozoon intestinalis ATCC 50506]ADM11409.1 thymidylate kinase [Encephalitozoon intestinalis ATCC 50506]UTX45101.1 thymidylate kinase [Encephalitozoon intestinalis]